MEIKVVKDILSTESKLRRTYQIAHILHKEQVNISQRQLAQSATDHIGIKMATAIGVYLDDRHALLAYRLGIHAGANIPLNDTDPGFAFQLLYRL